MKLRPFNKQFIQHATYCQHRPWSWPVALEMARNDDDAGKCVTRISTERYFNCISFLVSLNLPFWDHEMLKCCLSRSNDRSVAPTSTTSVNQRWSWSPAVLRNHCRRFLCIYFWMFTVKSEYKTPISSPNSSSVFFSNSLPRQRVSNTIVRRHTPPNTPPWYCDVIQKYWRKQSPPR